ncbi:MAG: dethiobiotin synthase [Cellvibrionales bacterium]|nr:dethiobiotin synthase [Cellvibrionales bacterium]
MNHPPDRGYFITGTDTEVGKTHVAVALIHHLKKQGLRVSALKPVASGSIQTATGPASPDAQQLQAAANLKLDSPPTNRYLFAPPIAPHIAAKQAGVRIDLQAIKRDADQVAAQADCLVVEGAGGWLVPLTERETMADLAQLLGFPVILVVGMRLGCINHALLSLREIARTGTPLKGWVANHHQAPATKSRPQVKAIQARTNAPLLTEIEFTPAKTKAPIWNL